MTRRRHAAFTLVELLVATAVSAVLSGIIYTVGSEALTAFARNISINRSYSDARSTLERIANAVQSAGHPPILLDSTGMPTPGVLLPSGVYAAAGIRFYRYGVTPTYVIPNGTSATTTLNINIVPGQYAPDIGDLVAIGQIAFQGTITSMSGALSPGTRNPDSPSTAPRVDTLTFANTISAGCSPPLTTTQSFVYAAGNPTADPPVAANSFSCQIYTQVAFISVPPANGTANGSTQLRYYPRAMSASSSGTASGGSSSFNGTTVFNNAANYKVIASLPMGGTTTQLEPFQLAATNRPSLSVTIFAEGPDYNNRGLHTANTLTQMQSTLGTRLPFQVLRSPY